MPKYNSYRVVDEAPLRRIKEPETKIRSRLDAKLKIQSPYSGREYVFDGAGSVQDVDKEDVNWLLEKRRNKGCCGGGGEGAIFELVEE